MSDIGQRERETQKRVIELFSNRLGYAYLGDWTDRPENSNVEEKLLRTWLEDRNISTSLIDRVIRRFKTAAAVGGQRSRYDANREVYELLRYGVKQREEEGERHETVMLIDWEHPERNHFGIAEEVTVAGIHTKRPDIVLYVNGIALAVLELKRSIVSVSEGIRQNLDNQTGNFIPSFFSTMQLVMAGNDTEGLRYGTIQTPERYYLTWKEEGVGNTLDEHLACLCSRERLLEIIHDFIVFDSGVKKIPRHNQYFGVRAAQERVRRREGGIIWHTQGSGKTLTMVWLAKWIREHVTDARVVIITDRDELDEQIEGVFLGVSEKIYRTKSGADLLSKLNATGEWLICSLVHKFGRSEKAEVEDYVAELKQNMAAGFSAKGELFVFVDECHRTQSGVLHKAMKEIMPNAMFIGFTGTPLLKADKRKSIEVFGSYIHTYKFNEAVKDRVVLDLCYEARDIDQRLASPEKVDQWFELSTRGLSDLAKAQLKQRWGTMQKVLSSRDRLEMIAADIMMDMETKDRLMSRRGNAMLVSASIYQACTLFDIFSRTDLKGRCAIITSYRPSVASIKGEETGEGETENLFKFATYRKMIADFLGDTEENAIGRVEEFEKKVKQRFIDHPGQMQLLIVVDKLLTGFDAPPATYLYIDKQMRDHGLFQAICRVNRLDGDDKEYGCIIDYKDLFKSLEQAVQDYTSGALDGYDREDIEGLLINRLVMARERLEECREVVKALCEPVLPPKDSAAYRHYFAAADTSDKDALKENEPKRVALYKAVSALVRAYANLANEMPEAGYSAAEIGVIKAEVTFYENLRQEVKLASGDNLDMKKLEPAMRHLLDAYIRAEDSQVIAMFDKQGLIELIVEKGLGEATERLPKGIRENPEAMAETIENNMRRLIIDEHPVNPRYYEKMSDLLDALIRERKAQAVDYKTYMEKLAELARQVTRPEQTSAYPRSLNTPGKRALYDNLERDEELTMRIDSTVRTTRKDGWRGSYLKERELRTAIAEQLAPYEAKADEIFEIIKNQHEY
jgi:type I restriction enzyme R subunit